MSKKYWYKMKRPRGPGSQPKGIVDFNDDEGDYGIIAYERELTEQEIEEYELKKYEEK